MALPPLPVGSVQVTVAEFMPGVAVTPVGAPGLVGAGVTGGEAAEVGPAPAELTATAVK